MKRILQVFGRMDRGGAETLMMEIYRQMDRSLVQFDFAVHSAQPGEYDSEIVALGGRVLPLPAPARVGLQRYSHALRELLHREGPFAGVHSHVQLFSGMVLACAAAAGVPLRLAHSHSTSDGQGDGWLRRAYRWYMRRLLSAHATDVLACSELALLALLGPGARRDARARVLPNGVDLQAYAGLPQDRAAVRSALGLPAGEPLIGHVGRFVAEKNHRYVVDVFAAALGRLPRAQLVLAGEGPLRGEVEELVGRAGLTDRVAFLGLCRQVPQLMLALDVLLLPSLYEGLPMVLVEAQAAGTPAVVSDRVPREVDAGLGLVRFCSLEAGIEAWVQGIGDALAAARPPWQARRRALEVAGRDVRESARWLSDVYSKA
ncbi:MAG: glycosyltransferase [Anaerolineae bacterium]